MTCFGAILVILGLLMIYTSAYFDGQKDAYKEANERLKKSINNQ